MVSDRQVRRLIKLKTRGRSLTNAASMAEMDEKTARKYLRSGKLPSESRARHTWRTRQDPFAEVWSEVQWMLENDARVIFQNPLHFAPYLNKRILARTPSVRCSTFAGQSP